MRISDWSSDVCSSDLRIEIGDRQRPGDERTSARSAPRPHRNALRLRPLDELGDDQEIAGKTHAGDDVDLEREPLLIGAALMLGNAGRIEAARSEEHTSELQSLMRISYAVFCLKNNTKLKS